MKSLVNFWAYQDSKLIKKKKKKNKQLTETKQKLRVNSQARRVGMYSYRMYKKKQEREKQKVLKKESKKITRTLQKRMMVSQVLKFLLIQTSLKLRSKKLLMMKTLTYASKFCADLSGDKSETMKLSILKQLLQRREKLKQTQRKKSLKIKLSRRK